MTASGEFRITVYSDPGHAWGAVPVALLAALGIAGRVSRYSYLDPRTGTAYLEEDCDLPRFVEAARARGITVAWDERHTDLPCFVRRLPRYQAGALLARPTRKSGTAPWGAMMSETRYLVVIQAAEEGGYVAFVPDLPGCLTQGETLDETIRNIQEAMALWLATEAEAGNAPPRASAVVAAWLSPAKGAP